MHQVPVLTTARLRLRAHRMDDFTGVHGLWSDPSVVRHISAKPSTPAQSWSRLLRYAGHWALLGFGYWVVEDRQTSRFIGEVGLADYHREIEPSFEGKPEAGWVMAPDAQGRGLAREAVRAVLAWADANIAAERTVCMIAPEHTASRRLASAVGFQESGVALYAGSEVVIYERPRSTKS
ncbi:MAG: GNAT family N-acetyltransferase [Pseudomonadota bacterium]